MTDAILLITGYSTLCTVWFVVAKISEKFNLLNKSHVYQRRKR